MLHQHKYGEYGSEKGLYFTSNGIASVVDEEKYMQDNSHQ